MADQLFIGIDSGTQGSKVVVFSRNQGKVLAESSAPHLLIENERGGREQDPASWVAAIESIMEQALAAVNPKYVRAISVSGQQHGFVPLDNKGEVIRPAKLWCDTETVAQCQTLTEKLGGEASVINTIGNSIAAGFTASKILWLKEHEPENYQRLQTVLLPHDYLNYWLSGEYCTEHGDASGTACYDVRSREWSAPLLQAIDASGKLLECLPPLRDPEEPCGRIRQKLAERWGLPRDVLIASGGGDNMMAAIGTGNVSRGVITASLGTSGTIYGFSPEPVIDSEGELAAFCSSSGGWLPLVCTMNVTVATELVREVFGFTLDHFNSAVASADPGSGGILLVPFFNGERTPALPGASASLHGMTTTNFTRENICRAAMEGVTLGLRYGLEVLERNGLQPEEIRLVGGGAKSGVWRQMVADIFKRTVVSPVSTEAGALGAAIQAMWCYSHKYEGGEDILEFCNRYVELDFESRTEPDRIRTGVYDALYGRYLETELTNRPLYA